MTSSGLSFSRDYSGLAPVDADLAFTRFATADRQFVFQGSTDGERLYAAFNLKLRSESLSKLDHFFQISLELWAFEIEGRTILCAISQRPERDPSAIDKGNPSFVYGIEAINVSCLHHRADDQCTEADREMLADIIIKMLPAINKFKIAMTAIPFDDFFRVEQTWRNPNVQLDNLFEQSTRVARTVEEANAAVSGIDEFYISDWRSSGQFFGSNRHNVEIKGVKSEKISTFAVTVDGTRFDYNYEFAPEKKSTDVYLNMILYGPYSPNAVRATVFAEESGAMPPEGAAVEANRIAKFQAYRHAWNTAGKKYPNAPISIIFVEGAL